MRLSPEKPRALLLCAVLLVTPLVFWPWSREAYHVVKETGVLLFSIPALALWFLAGRPGFSMVPRWYVVVAALFLALVAVRAVGTADGAAGAVSAGEWGLALLAGVSALGLPGTQRRRALGFLVAGTALVSLFGILQHFLGMSLFVPYKVDPRSVTFTSERVFGTFGNPIFFAGHLLLVIPLTVALLTDLAGGPRLRRNLVGAALALEVAALFLSSSRSAFLGLAAGAALMGLAARGLRRGLLALGVLVLLAGGLAAVLRPALVEHILVAGDPGRILMWKTGGRMLADSPLLGAGTGQFSNIYPCVQLKVADPGDAGFGVNAVHAHNDFIEAAAEWGVPGAAIFAALVLGLLFLPGSGNMAWGVRAGTAGLLVHALFNFPLRVAPTAVFAFLFPALWLLPEGDAVRPPVPRPRHLAWFLAFAAMAVALRPLVRSSYLQWALAYQDGRNYGRSAELFNRAEKVMPDDSSARVTFHAGKMLYEGGDILGAQAAFEIDLSRFPCYPESWGNLGVVYGVRAMNGEGGALAKAEKLVLKALSLRPGGQESAGDYNSLGNIRVLAGNEKGAMEAYREALKWNPAMPEAAGAAISLLVKRGKRDEAREIMLKALEKDPENRELAGLARALGLSR